MSPEKDLDTDQIIDTFGELVSALAAFAAKVPATSFMVNQSIRPTEETIEAFEEVVYRFRNRSGMIFRILNPFFIDSLEAFESGRVFDAVPPLLQAVEQLVELHKEEKVEYTDQQQRRIR